MGALEGANFIDTDTMKYSSSSLNPEYPFDNTNIDALEGITVDLENEGEYIDGLAGKPDNTDEVTGVRVVDALKGKVGVWQQFGAGAMVTQIISKGLRLNFVKKMLGQYRESNNQSFKRNSVSTSNVELEIRILYLPTFGYQKRTK